jgi:hypothetical protein
VAELTTPTKLTRYLYVTFLVNLSSILFKKKLKRNSVGSSAFKVLYQDFSKKIINVYIIFYPELKKLNLFNWVIGGR